MAISNKDKVSFATWFKYKRDIEIVTERKDGRKIRKTYYAYYNGYITNSKKKVMKRILKTRVSKKGKTYYIIQVALCGKMFNYARILLDAWDDTFDNLDKEKVVVYKNGNMFDLRVSNLTWKKREYNVKKLTEQQQNEIKYIYKNRKTLYKDKYITYVTLAELYNVSRDTIRKVIKGEY